MERVGSKCEHGVYFPAGDPVNLGCQLCNPDGLGAGEAPVLPHSSGDTLHHKTSTVDTCVCGNVRTYSLPNCRVCHRPFPETEQRGRSQTAANSRQAGVCPECGSTVHYEMLKKGWWCCADCECEYRAPKLRGEE